MRKRFSLSRAVEKMLPDTVRGDDGRICAVDADFRTVLRCLRVLCDPDIKDQDKLYLLMRWFFKGAYVQGAVEMFLAFASFDGEDDGAPPQMDFEADADAIYSGFLQVYGLDLIDVPFLHWWRFVALLGGLNEDTLLGRRVALRGMDTSKMPPEERVKWERAKASVRLERPVSAEEAALQAELDQRLAAGENPGEIIKRLKELRG